jgi:hypothetical protein
MSDIEDFAGAMLDLPSAMMSRSAMYPSSWPHAGGEIVRARKGDKTLRIVGRASALSRGLYVQSHARTNVTAQWLLAGGLVAPPRGAR